ncbi:MAG: rhomboid family intramembrane serine protease [Pseudonocardia sp.]|nr:rhomboid family intramembrane serine protease [Pseudonocardia sp.]
MTNSVVGLRRAPVLTGVLTLVTAVVSVAGLVWPAVLAALARSGAADQPWRWVTSLLVQDGGVAGTVSNLGFLAVLGMAAEQVVGRVALVGCYLAAGLAGQVAGVFWQPYGAGNSVAVCGLAGVLVWVCSDEDVPRWAGSAVALWLGALLGTWWLPLVALGVVGAAVDRRVLLGAPGVRVPVWVTASVAVACVLIGLGNIHGVALAVGTVLGWFAGKVRAARPGT